MLTQEQVDIIKKRLISQIEATFPEDRKQFAKEQIDLMDSEQLEKFLIKNNLIKTEGSSKENCVFCSIISGDIKSYEVSQNKKALAVLEINPMAKGHVIVIPKDHVSSQEEMPEEAKNLAKRISSRIKAKLRPKSIRIEFSNLLGHEVINVIPVYAGPEPVEKRHATPDELSELQKVLKAGIQKKTGERKGNRPGIRKIIKKVEEFEEKLWLPKRIP